MIENWPFSAFLAIFTSHLKMDKRASRYLAESIDRLAIQRQKMAFVSGPRQVGKTTLGKGLLHARGSGRYYTWDDISMRRGWIKEPSQLLVPTVTRKSARPMYIFDGIHKAKGWKNTIKGLYDLHHEQCDLFVTGSARLNVYRRGGDSLLGRYLHFRLHPFSLGEMLGKKKQAPDDVVANLRDPGQPSAAAQSAFESLFRLGGFPEPLFDGRAEISNLWRRNRLEKIIREDLRDLSRIPDLSRIEMLASLLPERVGSQLSVQSLREDLEVAHETVRRWLNALDALYYCYEIKTYAKTVARSIRKEGKLYLWDWSEVSFAGPRFENLIAGHLAKACAFWTDTGVGDFSLHYLRDKERHEIDFLIVRDKEPWLAVEAKMSDTELAPDFARFARSLGALPCVQVVHKSISPKVSAGGVVVSAAEFCSWLP
jgi:uncharacterized protein